MLSILINKRPGLATRAFAYLTKMEILGFGLRLLEAQATVAFLPLSALLQEVNALETLQDVALGSDLTGTLKRCVLAHCLLFLSTGAYYTIISPRIQGGLPLFPPEEAGA